MIPINTTNTRQNITCKMRVDFTASKKIFCSYTHSIEYAEGVKIMYAGACEFRNMLEATDARKNSAWREHISQTKGVIVNILALFEYKHEAQNHVSTIVREQKPYCNVHGIKAGKGGPIRNVVEDRTFDTASDAARYYGISPATLSNHLNHRAGYLTIRGMTFERL